MNKFAITAQGAQVLEKLNKAGYEAYIVGGSVRDMTLGLEAGDIDITTSARPDQILGVFSDYKTVEIGKKYGTIGIICEGQMVEVTTYRLDGAYQDGRRPKDVAFSTSLIEDLRRRDFTINAMAMDIDLNIIDPFGGRADIDRRLVKTVGDPNLRFEEDKLRILRAVRFASVLDFTIEDRTWQAIKEKSHKINEVSQERIQDELNKMILADYPSRSMDLLEKSGLLAEIIPEIMPTVGYDQMSPYHHKSLFKHMTCLMDRTRKNLDLRLAALFHDIDKPKTLSIDEDGIGHFYGHEDKSSETASIVLKRLKYPKKTIKNVRILIENHMSADPNMKDKGIKRLIARVGEDLIHDLIDLMIADTLCTKEGRDVSFLISMREKVTQILDEDELVDQSSLAVDGNDLISIGYTPGPYLGKVLGLLTDIAMDDDNLNDRDYLLKIAKEKLEDR